MAPLDRPQPSIEAAPHAEWVAFVTLFTKEVLRFWKVALQTVAAPVLNALLFLLIFSNVLDRHVTTYGEVAYPTFLIPGLAIMSVMQNAFANSSSSLIQSRITGNLVFILLTPLSNATFFWGYALAATRALQRGRRHRQPQGEHQHVPQLGRRRADAPAGEECRRHHRAHQLWAHLR